MNHLKTTVRQLWLALLAGACFLVVRATAWAAPHVEPTTEKTSAGDWVLSYFIVVLSIALGMLVVCRTSRRAERARPDKYEGIKTAD